MCVCSSFLPIVLHNIDCMHNVYHVLYSYLSFIEKAESVITHKQNDSFHESRKLDELLPSAKSRDPNQSPNNPLPWLSAEPQPTARA